MGKPFCSRYHQKGWQWKIAALEMQHREEMAQAEFPLTMSCGLQVTAAALQDGGKSWFTGTTAFLPVCKLQEDCGSSCFSSWEWVCILKLGHIPEFACGVSNKEPASWHWPLHFPKPHQMPPYFIWAAVLVCLKIKDNEKYRKIDPI